MEAFSKIYVLYGSQTGNAESIAKDLYERLRDNAEFGPVDCMTLNNFKQVKTYEQNSMLVIVCSTTGNGDAPENADAWWRNVKMRSTAKDKFAGVNYCVLGLGDSNYDKFCFMGKSIDKRMAEIGANRVLPISCADEATNLEETVEAWKIEIIKVLTPKKVECAVAEEVPTETSCCQKECISQDCSTTVCAVETAVIESAKTVNPTSILDSYMQTIPSGLQRLSEIIKNSSVQGELENALKNYQPAVYSSNHSSDAKLIANGAVEYSVEEKQPAEKGQQEYSVENPFEAKVTTAKWLTDPAVSQASLQEDSNSWGEAKRVIYMQLSLHGSNIQYLPGDSIGICCPNPDYAVELVLSRLIGSGNTITKDTLIQCQGMSKPATLVDILSNKYDLTSMPKKATVKTLAKFCSDPMESQLLQLLAGKDKVSKQLWKEFIEDQGVGVAELLFLFPSCSPSITELLDVLSPLPPRYYSIASSPMADANLAAVAFSVVRFSCNNDKIRRSGVCTTYLERQLANWLYDTNNNTSTPLPNSKIIRIFHKPSLTFRLPGSVAYPLILIGPGTGVAPFLGFLEHRYYMEKQRKKSGGEDISMGVWRGGFELDIADLPCEGNTVETFIHSVPPGPIHLFFGCRNQQDYLFEKELQDYLSIGTLSTLNVAMSRVKEEKEYVTHKLKEDGKKIARLIVDHCAHIYICGDGNKMAKDVIATLKECLVEFANCTTESANKYILELQQKKKLLMDIWSG